MQDTRDLFKGACAYPCDMLAAIIEMEHRANDTEREECIETATAVLREMMLHYEDMPTDDLALKSERIEISLLQSMLADAKLAQGDDIPGGKGDGYEM